MNNQARSTLNPEHRFGYRHSYNGVLSEGTVISHNQEQAWRIVAWCIGGSIWPKGSGHPRLKISIRNHPFHHTMKSAPLTLNDMHGVSL